MREQDRERLRTLRTERRHGARGARRNLHARVAALLVFGAIVVLIAKQEIPWVDSRVERMLDEPAWLAAEQTSPSRYVARQEEALHLSEALTRLPDAQREALVLRYWDGWSLKEISRQMDRSLTAVAGLLKRGLKQLRTALQEGGE